MTAVLGVWHFSFTVSDLDEAVRFYVDVLGFHCVGRQEQANAYTRRLVGYPNASLRVAQLSVPGQQPTISGHHLELVQYLEPVGERGSREICNPGAAHLALTVADLAAEHERLEARGVHFFSSPNAITAGVNRGGWTVYFHGPDDIVHELVQPPAKRVEGIPAPAHRP
jgi:catechol 2,3-dioxygenase-like lactoylglutathione lyase family enzyme